MRFDKSENNRILCIDNNHDICELIIFLLEQEGFHVISVHNPSQAFESLSHQPFAAVILDHHLPDISGIELCRQIKASDATIPVIFFTGVTSPAERERAIIAGADAYLIRPDDLRRLGEVIETLMQTPVKNTLRQPELA